MKEIKYQVYHKPTKTIQVVAVIDFNNRVLDTYGIDEPIYDIPFEDVEWREYISKKDKLGSDIYTRDIIRYGDYESGQLVNKVMLIQWEEKHYNRQFEPIGFHLPYAELELVGNIDQNPELLNEN
jgi:hypothetical protein